MCLLAKCYAAAQPLLDQEVRLFGLPPLGRTLEPTLDPTLEPHPGPTVSVTGCLSTVSTRARCVAVQLLQVDKEATCVAPRDLLLFHYYEGMIHVGLRRFKQAIQSFTLCFSAPSFVLNAIMVEAYKKCLLCSLVESGESPRAPKHTALVVLRHIKSGIAPYTEFAETFSSRTLADLRASLEKHSVAFEQDKNLGLAKQCVQALIRRNILRLTQTYLTLSLTHIADSAGLADAAEAERYITRMVAAGEISAAIDESKGVVRIRAPSMK